MSDFRKFCFAYFIASGLMVAGVNHGLLTEPKDGAAGLMMLGLALASCFVCFFGKRDHA